MVTKVEALKKGIFWKCNKCGAYSKLDINSKINLKSEIAYYWHKKYQIEFQEHTKPIFQDFEDKGIEEFIHQEYLFSRGF